MVACSALVRSLAHVLKAERKPWTVVRSASPLSRKELRQRHIRQRLPSPRWGRKGQAAAVGEGPRLFEHGHRRVAQRLAVFNPALHAVRGMRHSLFSGLTSSHFAPRTSPLRAAVSTSSLKHSLTDSDAFDTCIASRALGILLVGKGAEVLLNGPHGRQATIYGFASHVVLNEAVGLAPAQSGLDGPPHPTCRFRLGGPDRRQDGQHVLTPDLVHRHVPEARERMAFQLLHPVRFDLGVAPARFCWPRRSAPRRTGRSESESCASRPAGPGRLRWLSGWRRRAAGLWRERRRASRRARCHDGGRRW